MGPVPGLLSVQLPPDVQQQRTENSRRRAVPPTSHTEPAILAAPGDTTTRPTTLGISHGREPFSYLHLKRFQYPNEGL